MIAKKGNEKKALEVKLSGEYIEREKQLRDSLIPLTHLKVVQVQPLLLLPLLLHIHL